MNKLKYSDIRHTIKTGDLLAWNKPKKGDKGGFVLFWYQKIFKAKYTHVAIAVKIGKRYFVIEATPPVVRLYPISMLDDFELFKLNLDLSKGKKSKYLNILFKELGKPYSLFDLVRNTIGMQNDKSNRYCSQLAAYFYKEIGLIENSIETGFTPDSLISDILSIIESEPVSVEIDRGNLNAV